MNVWNGIGRIGRDADLIETKDGSVTSKFQIAVDKRQKNKDPDWISCSLYGDRAKIMSPYMKKGRLIGVTGQLASYKDTKGHYKTIVNVDNITFLESSKKEEEKEEEEMPF